MPISVNVLLQHFAKAIIYLNQMMFLCMWHQSFRDKTLCCVQLRHFSLIWVIFVIKYELKAFSLSLKTLNNIHLRNLWDTNHLNRTISTQYVKSLTKQIWWCVHLRACVSNWKYINKYMFLWGCIYFNIHRS